MNESSTVTGQGTTLVENETETKAVRAPRPPLIPTPITTSNRKPLIFRFFVGREFIRKFDIPDADLRKNGIQLYHLYPKLCHYVARTIGDEINPRSHSVECLKSPVAKKIEETLMENSSDFYLINRGVTILADNVSFDPKTGFIEITLGNPEETGALDGATSDAVLSLVQVRLAREILENKNATYQDLIDSGKLPDILENGRIHLEILVGLKNRSRLAHVVEGRNTSKSVRGWSLADFRNEFDIFKDMLESEESPVKGRVGYEENADSDISIMYILALATLFHPEFDQKNQMGADKSPTLAYSSKNQLDRRLLDPNLAEGYKEISSLILDIVKLHDYIYLKFPENYDRVYGVKSRLGRRPGVTSKLLDDPYILPMTQQPSSYVLPSGFLFPLIGAFRGLLIRRAGKLFWRLNPYEFFDKFGKNLIGELFEQAAEVGGRPNAVGKAASIYSNLYKTVKILLNDELEERKETKEKANTK